MITAAGLIDLVFDVSGKARLHGTLRKQFFSIFAEAKPSSDIGELTGRMEAIFADEPPIMHAVNALSYNTAMAAFGRPPRFFMRIGWWRRFSRHLLPASADSFLTIEESQAAR